MNRLVCTNKDAVRPEMLPPTRREGGGPARVLFIHGYELGFGTTGRKVDHRTDASVLLAADAVAFASRWAMDSAVKDYGVDAAKCFLHRPCARVSPLHQLSPLAGPTAKIVFVGNDWERKGGPRLL